LVAIVNIDGTGTINTPSGWTLISSATRSTILRVATFYKVAGGSEPASYTFDGWSSVSSAAAVSAYSGVDNAAPLDVNGVGNGNSSTPTAPDVTTTADNCMVIGLAGNDRADRGPYTPPTGYTERCDQTGGLFASGAHISTADIIQATAGATGTAAFTLAVSSDHWVVHHIALAPASGSSFQPAWAMGANNLL
jgi:hypothetical protein